MPGKEHRFGVRIDDDLYGRFRRIRLLRQIATDKEAVILALAQWVDSEKPLDTISKIPDTDTASIKRYTELLSSEIGDVFRGMVDAAWEELRAAKERKLAVEAESADGKTKRMDRKAGRA